MIKTALAAITFASTLFCSPAFSMTAAPISQWQQMDTVLVKGGHGHGHGHMRRGGRGHHYGWYRGRGHHRGYYR
jgi:hypothetical protein